MKLLNTFSISRHFSWRAIFFPFDIARLLAERELKGIVPLTLILVLTSFISLPAQSLSETIRETAQFQNVSSSENELYIHNIQGNVTVEGFDGDEVLISYEKKIYADTQHDLERGKEEVEVIINEEGDQVHIFLDAPFIQVRKNGSEISYHIKDWDDSYDFTLDIAVQVPRNTNLDISTINKGKISAENMRGRWLDASNVNGSVELVNVAGITEANTVNGDITASYNEIPTGNSSYQTVNGTIEVMYPENLSADITFKSMHGDLYTDFQNLQRLEPRVESGEDRKRGAITYRIDKFAPVRIGNGGPEFSFEVLNGDVYIKKNKSKIITG